MLGKPTVPTFHNILFWSMGDVIHTTSYLQKWLYFKQECGEWSWLTVLLVSWDWKGLFALVLGPHLGSEYAET